MRVTVVNVGGSSRHETSPEGLAWKAHWEQVGGCKFPEKCVCCHQRPAEVGGHVYIEGSKKQFIVPMCRECNRKPAGTAFPNVDEIWLVPVDPRA